MKSEVVRDPDGRQWRVSVRMLPWRPRLRWPWSIGRGRKQGSEPRPDGSIDPSLAADALFFDELVLIGIAVLVALAILPTFIFVIEVVILLVVMIGTVLVRVLFRQPWIVDATADDGTRKAWKLVGYRTARRAVSDISRLLAQGVSDPALHDAELVR